MKNILLILVALLVGSGCSKDKVAYNDEYNTSYDAWGNFKQNVNNSYTYTVTTGSFFGYATETVLSVRNGRVISRAYTAVRTGQGPSLPPTTVASWTEDLTSLNTHANAGAKTLTLDEIYVKAKDTWLNVNKKDNDVFFEAKNSGMISTCGCVPKGCQDDCFVGITISNISALSKQP